MVNHNQSSGLSGVNESSNHALTFGIIILSNLMGLFEGVNDNDPRIKSCHFILEKHRVVGVEDVERPRVETLSIRVEDGQWNDALPRLCEFFKSVHPEDTWGVKLDIQYRGLVGGKAEPRRAPSEGLSELKRDETLPNLGIAIDEHGPTRGEHVID